MDKRRRLLVEIILILSTTAAVLGYIHLVFSPPECRRPGDVPRYCVD
jgi:hypothetical protein